MHQSLEERLNRRPPVLLDGAMGTELVRRGVRWRIGNVARLRRYSAASFQSLPARTKVNAACAGSTW